MQDGRVGTYKTEAIGIWIHPNIFWQLLARHPGRDGLERSDGDTQKRNDVWMHQTFPHHGLPTEVLCFLSGTGAERW